MSEEKRSTTFGCGMWPFEFWCQINADPAASHFRQSRIEFLKGLRTLIDMRIERLSKEDEKGSKVVVE